MCLYTQEYAEAAPRPGGAVPRESGPREKTDFCFGHTHKQIIFMQLGCETMVRRVYTYLCFFARIVVERLHLCVVCI